MNRTIKFRILSGNILIICIIGIIFSISSYVTAGHRTVEVAQNSLTYHVESTTRTYGVAYDEMMNILLNCAEREMIDLTRVGGLGTSGQKRKGVEYAKLIGDFCAVTGYGKYISRLSVFGENGVHISAGTAQGSVDDVERILGEAWFAAEEQKDSSYYLLDIVDSPFYREESRTLPIIVKTADGRNARWVGLFLSPALYEEELRKNDNGNEILVVTWQGERVATLHEAAENAQENDVLIQRILKRGGEQGLLEQRVHGRDSIVAWCTEGRSGITTIEILDKGLLKNDRLMLMQTVVMIFVACVILGVMLSVFFSQSVRKPIDRLVAHLGHVAEGEFRQDSTIESEDEIGQIGKVVNVMSGQIEQLMEKRLEDEKEKNDMELKMLQAQINPHFLYNTLDSIRWIAVIQKNSGIVKAVTALSKLLKNMAKGFHEKVTLREELDFVNDYVIIEKMKYAEMFDVQIEVEHEALYQARIVKLTLQPLVENAIFSGIEPTGRNGMITIHISEEEGDLLLVVSDDGVGIEEDRIAGLLEDNDRLKGDRMSSIGMANVNRRIKLIYGEEYGLRVESKIREYTSVHIRVPLEYASK